MEKQFTKLTKEEMIDINGGIFGIDDTIFGGLFIIGFSIGVLVGTNRKNSEKGYKK